MKRCNKCQVEKSPNEFYNAAAYTCKSCVSLKNKELRQQNPKYKKQDGKPLKDAADIQKLLSTFTEIKREPEEYRSKPARKQIVQDNFMYKWVENE